MALFLFFFGLEQDFQKTLVSVANLNLKFQAGIRGV